MKKRVMLSLIIFIVLFLLWIWSYRGIDIEAKIVIEGDTTYVYFDDFPIASACAPGQEISQIKVDLTYQDLDTKYFKGQSYADRDTLPVKQKNCEFKVKMTNPFHVFLTFQGKHSYKLDIAPYRHLHIIWDDPEGAIKYQTIGDLRFNIFKTIQWMLWIILKPFPFVCIIFAILYLNFFISAARKSLPLQENTGRSSPLFLIIPILISISSCLWSRYLMNKFTLTVPHLPDAIAYILLGKMISSGRFLIPYSEVPSFIPRSKIPDYFFPWFHNHNNELFIPYLTGHPLLLAIGNILGDISWVPPVIGAATLLIIFFITFKITGSYIFSSLAMIICLVSPFFQTQTIDYMSHNTVAFYLLIEIIPLFLKRHCWYAITGFFMGMLFNTRPLNCVAVISAIAFYEIVCYILDRDTKKILWKILYSAAGILLPVVLFLYYNHLITGEMLTTPYIYHSNVLNKTIGGTDFIIERGFLQGFTHIIVFSLFFLRNYYITFAPLLISLFLLPFSFVYFRKIFLFQILIFAILASCCLYDGNYFMYGPRFIYESVPLFAILYALTFYITLKLASGRVFKTIFLIVLIIYLGNLVVLELQWTGVKEPEYGGIWFVPGTVKDLKDYYYIKGCFYDLYLENKGKNKIFLMEFDVYWMSTGEGIWFNSFPLSESKPIFLSKPQDYGGEIPEAQIIKWDGF